MSPHTHTHTQQEMCVHHLCAAPHILLDVNVVFCVKGQSGRWAFFPLAAVFKYTKASFKVRSRARKCLITGLFERSKHIIEHNLSECQVGVSLGTMSEACVGRSSA